MDTEGRIIDGRYRLVRHAGQGGMAQVWCAEALEAARPVAIKRILPALADDVAVRAMFADEARITAAFDHPNIVRFERYGSDAAGPYLAMEWVEGASLRELVAAADGPLPVTAVASVGADVLGALGAAHALRGAAPPGGLARRAPVIHRDVSPANVLVGTDGRAKLADFGLARALDRPRTVPRGTVPGKLGYLPPEVLAGAPHGVLGDLYSVGVVLWEALAGRRMFADAGEGAALARAVLSARRPPLRSVRPRVAPELAAVIDRAVALDPAARYPSAAAMADALRGAARAAGQPADADAVAALVRRARGAGWAAG